MPLNTGINADELPTLFAKYNELSTEDKLELLTSFKGHVKKELVDASAIELYFRVLLDTDTEIPESDAVDENSSKLSQLKHSSLCYLIKRVTMQAPSIFHDSNTVNRIILYLLLHAPSDTAPQSLERKKFWVPSIKAIESVYQISSSQVIKCLSGALEEIPSDGSISNEKKWQIYRSIVSATIEITKDSGSSALKDFLPVIARTLHQDDANESLSKEIQITTELVADLWIIEVKKPSIPIQTVDFKDFRVRQYFQTLIDKKKSDANTPDSIKSLDSKDISFNAIFDVESELSALINESIPPNFNDSYANANRAHSSVIIYETQSHFRADFEKLLIPFRDSKETEQNWKSRQTNVYQFRALIAANNNEESILKRDPDGVIETLKDIQFIEMISKAVHSLRTTLSFASCLLLRDVLNAFSSSLSNYMIESIFNVFKTLLSSTKKISSQIAFHCIVILLSNLTSFNNKQFQNSFVLINSKHIFSRQSSCLFLRVFIIKFANDSKFDSNTVYIEEWLKKGLTDPQTSVRETMRLTFWYYYKCYEKSAKRVMSNGITPQLKKAIELAIPPHLNVNYHQHTSLSSSSSTNSSRRSSLVGQRRFPSYAQPTQSSTHLRNQSTSTASNMRSASAISTRDSVLNKNSVSGYQNTTNIRKISTPLPTSNAKFVADSSTHTINLDGSFSQKVHNGIDIDLSEEIRSLESHTNKKKHMGNALQYHDNNQKSAHDRDGSSTDNQILLRLRRLADKYNNNSNLTAEEMNSFLIEFLEYASKNSPKADAIDKFIKPLRGIMIALPSQTKKLMRSDWFMRNFKLTYLIELCAINETSISSLMEAKSDILSLLKCCTEILNNLEISNADEGKNDENSIGGLTTLSLYYLKFRRIFYNYCFSVIKEIIAGKKLQIGSSTPIIQNLIEVFCKINGKDYDSSLYYDVLYSIYKFDRGIFIAHLKEMPLFPTVFKVCNELKERHSDFVFNEILEEAESQVNGITKEISVGAQSNKEDEYKQYMEMTMVNPFAKKQDERIPSTGSVVHNPDMVTAFGDNSTVENSNDKKRPYSDDTENISLGNDTMRLTEMTKIVFPSLQATKKMKTPSSEEKINKSIEISDLFQDKEATEKPEKLLSDNANSSIASNNTIATVNDSPSVEVKVEELKKSPTNTININYEKDGDSRDIPIVSLGSESLNSQLTEIKDDLTDSVSEIDLKPDMLQMSVTCSPAILLEYYALLFKSEGAGKDCDADLSRLKKSLQRIKTKGFTIKHIDQIIKPLLFLESNEPLKVWLEDGGGYQDLLDLVAMILQSLGESDQLPLKLIGKSMALLFSLIAFIPLLKDSASLRSMSLQTIWENIVTIVGNLNVQESEIYGYFAEVRNQLVKQGFFDSKSITRMLNILMVEIDDEKVTKKIFLIETMKEIIRSKPPWTDKTYRLMEIVQTLAYLIESKTSTVRKACFECLILIFQLSNGKSKSFKQEVVELFQCIPDNVNKLIEHYCSFI